MQSSLEITKGLERRLTITIPGKDITQELNNRLKSLTQTVRIAGFRPGKIPLALIHKRFGTQVRQEVVDELIKSSLTNVLAEHQMRLANTPTLELTAGDESLQGDVRYTATFEVYPEVNLAPLKELVINRPEVLINESDIDTMLENFRHQCQTWTQIGDRPAMLGDRVKVDFTSTLTDGKDYSGNIGNDVLIILGEGIFIAGFERHLIGVMTGETRVVEVTFPVGYHNSEIAGKSAIFNIVVKSVESAKIPELDEIFIRNFGVVEGTLEAMRQSIRKVMERNFESKVWQLAKNQVMDALCQINSLEIPKKLLEEEIIRLRSEFSIDQLSNVLLENQARRNVTLGIIINEIIVRQNLKVDPKRVRAYIRSLAEDYETPEEVERVYLSDKNQLKEIEAAVTEDMVVEWVLEQVQVKMIPTPFSALASPITLKVERGIKS
ncbi:Trigger factor [Gammaproteobacteria bacterium]